MSLPLLLLFAVLFYFGWSAWRRLPLHDRSFATRGGLALLLINLLLLLGWSSYPADSSCSRLCPHSSRSVRRSRSCEMLDNVCVNGSRSSRVLSGQNG
jgi:hypothetical protein